MQIATTRRLLAGLAAGDSLGSTSEFLTASGVSALYDPMGWPFKQVGGGAFKWRPGEATDDTDMAWAMVKATLENGGKFDPAKVASEFVVWLDGNPPDVGATTRDTVSALRRNSWLQSGRVRYLRNRGDAANGSLMRNGVLPGLTAGEDVNELFRATVQHSIATHYGPLPVLCCAMQSWIIADELSGWEEGPEYNDAWLEAFHSDWSDYLEWEVNADDTVLDEWLYDTREQFQEAGEKIDEADFDPHSFNPFQASYAGRSGYCLLTLQIGVWALLHSHEVAAGKVSTPYGMPQMESIYQRTHDPFDVLAWVAMIGHDSDTYGATAGAMIAAAHEAIPGYFAEGLEVLPKFAAVVEANKASIKDAKIAADDVPHMRIAE